MKYDLTNNPTIPDCNPPHQITKTDLYDDCGDCVHAKSPQTGEEWRFYYTKKRGIKKLDQHGTIQL